MYITAPVSAEFFCPVMFLIKVFCDYSIKIPPPKLIALFSINTESSITNFFISLAYIPDPELEVLFLKVLLWSNTL